MRTIVNVVLILAFFSIMEPPSAMGEKSETFSAYVDGTGIITLPNEFSTTWSHLGSWTVTSQAAAGSTLGQANPGSGVHNVYTQTHALKAYKKAGTWPDGSILVMEVRSLTWDDLPTGHVIVEGNPVKWFVMVKDTKGRFPGNANWGDGWGWALFTPNNPKKNTSTDYKKDCMGCHETARATEWIFIHGYPALRLE